MDYAERLVYETEGQRGADERGWNGDAARDAELERQRMEYETYQQAQESMFHDQLP
jgi:hypothetical protein